MSRFWKRAVALAAFVLVLGVAFVNLGEWQLNRLEERRARNETILQHEQSPPKPYNEVFGPVITDADQWQRVTLTGTFDASRQFQVRYRYNDSRSGYEVVAPLQTINGDVVLVDRGFIELASGQEIPNTLPPPPPGEVTVVGYVRRNENGKPQAINPVNNQVRLINAPAMATVLPYPVMDGWVAALQVTPPQQPQFEPLALPEISDGPHFWYAMQWFLFALIGLTGLVVFIRGDLKERRARRTQGTGEPLETEPTEDRANEAQSEPATQAAQELVNDAAKEPAAPQD